MLQVQVDAKKHHRKSITANVDGNISNSPNDASQIADLARSKYEQCFLEEISLNGDVYWFYWPGDL